MRIMAVEIEPDPVFVREYDIILTSLDELLARADFVSLHVPLDERTANLIGPAELQTMQPTAFLINTARGGLIDEKALHRALTEKLIAGAALDVFNREPPGDSALLHLENVIATPHMSSFSREAIANMERMSAQNIIDALAGKRPGFVVNPEVFDKK